MKTSTTKRPGSTEKWLTYSGMATAFLAVTNQADAQIVYTDVDPDAVIDGGFLGVDFDQDAVPDVLFIQSMVSYGGLTGEIAFALPQNGGAMIGALAGTSTAYPSVLAAGAPIAPGNANWRAESIQGLGFVVNGLGAAGAWLDRSGYLGVRFITGANTYYGWIELAVTADAGRITLLGYAYQSTPNTAITAGDIGSVGIAEQRPSFDFSVFPNPTTDRVSIQLDARQAGSYQVAVRNGIGQVLSSLQVSSAGGVDKAELDLSTLPAGTYFVEVRNGTQVVHRKVTKVG